MNWWEGNDKDKMLAFKFGGQWRFDTEEIEGWKKDQGERNSTKKAIRKLLMSGLKERQHLPGK